ncbi:MULTISPECIES: HAD family hydrolase [Sphingomonas]|jgi:HAD superfamily hydrolase (TIGR01509 family)|uniref:HAD family phosphatase n=1 Tax=Sphingomonas zeae TaxID=1646122 RepID=A0A7Y6EGX9_9SPHN|nr:MULTISPECIES: HAD family phosphatase [Sphingomonas]MBB4049025.1 HAD superfamily hydrolase (TIGR01509 family) [Sphingomonas zeae]MDK8187355.1 HAD family phosphatase [Sphingomonas zeae]MDK8217097.1 HAD family phosphatase [Sphingomonas sp. UMB7805-LC452B]NUU46492.1 HAD family phosphatase [Sphingomonas zeae]
MSRFDALLFDFDGVLIDSEYEGNRHLAEWLTTNGHPHTPEEAMHHYMGLAGKDFVAAIEARIGHNLPESFYHARRAEDVRAMAEGVAAIGGAVAFVRSLPADFPKAIVSSSPTAWIDQHLRHIGLRELFGEHVYSGREHVTRGKPAPDLYLYAAEQLGVRIQDCAILEDSPVGATGAVASGGHVIGMCMGTHCAIGHDQRLRDIGVAAIAQDYDDVRRELDV